MVTEKLHIIFFNINYYKIVNLPQKINRDNIVLLNSVINQANLWCMKSVKTRGFFLFVFFRIWNEYAILQNNSSISPNLGKNGPKKYMYLNLSHAVLIKIFFTLLSIVFRFFTVVFFSSFFFLILLLWISFVFYDGLSKKAG